MLYLHLHFQKTQTCLYLSQTARHTHEINENIYTMHIQPDSYVKKLYSSVWLQSKNTVVYLRLLFLHSFCTVVELASIFLQFALKHDQNITTNTYKMYNKFLGPSVSYLSTQGGHLVMFAKKNKLKTFHMWKV